MAPYSFTIFTKKTMRKHIIPFSLEAPTQVINATGAQSWDGKTSKISITDGSDNVALSVDAVAAQGLVKPGALLVVQWNVASITATKKVTISYGGSAISELDAAGESVTFLFFNDRDSQDDAGWEVIAKDASTGDLSAVDLDMSGSLTIDTDLLEVNSTSRSIGFFGESAVEQPATTADVAAASSLPTDGTGDTLAGASYSQAEVSALIETVYDLMGLVNQLNADLKELGLKASS